MRMLRQRRWASVFVSRRSPDEIRGLCLFEVFGYDGHESDSFIRIKALFVQRVAVAWINWLTDISGFAPSGESLSLCLCKEKVTKEKAHPASGPGCAGVPSFHRCSRGTLRRDVPVPSELSRRPCRSTPCASTPLGLLRGPGSRPDLPRIDEAHSKAPAEAK